MPRVVFFTKMIEKILPNRTIWFNLEDEAVSTIFSTGKKKIIPIVGSKSLREGHVYDVQALSELLARTIKNLENQLGSNLILALPVNCSPVQKKLFKQAIRDQLGWGKKQTIDRAQALMAWSSYFSKQNNGLVLYIQPSYSEVVSFAKNKIQVAERLNWGSDNWVKKIQQHYLTLKQSLIPDNQVEKILKAFSVTDVLSDNKHHKLSVRAQDQQTKSTVTLSINSQELAGVYGVLVENLSKKLRRCFGNSLSQVSGVMVVTQREIKDLNSFIQEEFGWEWGGQSSSGYEVVVGMKLMDKIV